MKETKQKVDTSLAGFPKDKPKAIIQNFAVLLVFIIYFSRLWKITDLFHFIPSYGDPLEVTWGLERTIQMADDGFFWPLIDPNFFYPIGWNLGAFSTNPTLLALLSPIASVAGAAFAYNATAIFTVFLGYYGAYLFAKKIGVKPHIAILTALLFAFWGFKWTRVIGHLNISLLTSLLPYFFYYLPEQKPERKIFTTAIAAGISWGLAAHASLYAVFLFGVPFGLWVVWQLQQNRSNLVWLSRWSGVMLLTLFFVSWPSLLLYWLSSRAVEIKPFNLWHISSWGASLNSIFIPWNETLKPYFQAIYNGPGGEAGSTGMGLLAPLLALAAAPMLWRKKSRRVWLFIGLVGFVLALGVALHWNGEVVSWSGFNQLNHRVWNIAHALKPEVFGEHVPPSLQDGLYLPGFYLVAFLPGFESARVMSRYIFMTGVILFPMVGLALQQIRWPWLQLLLAFLLLVESNDIVTPKMPFPFLPHPAHEWLFNNDINEPLLDLEALDDEKLLVGMNGAVLYGANFHQAPILSASGSVIPLHTKALIDWHLLNDVPPEHSDWVPLLRSYGAKYILMHGKYEPESWASRIENVSGILLIDCFENYPGPSPYMYPICIFEIGSFGYEHTNFSGFAGHWSGNESWGFWAESDAVEAYWASWEKSSHQLEIEAFPNCNPSLNQTMTISINQNFFATFDWPDCETANLSYVIPADLIEIGMNRIDFNFEYALSPLELTDGQVPDARLLSVGFSRLEIGPLAVAGGGN